MKDLTDKPFGVNIAQAFVADPTAIVDFVIAQGVTFVTTSAGSPTKYTAQLKDAGPHRVPRRAHPAGRGEGGRRRRRRPDRRGRRGWRASRTHGRCRRWSCCPSVTSAFDVPVIAAGGFLDGPTMAAAFALGAEGVQLGTAMVSAQRVPRPPELEAGDHRRRRDRHRVPQRSRISGSAGPADRAHHPPRVRPRAPTPWASSARSRELYFGGDLEAGIALCGQVAGRI